MRWKCRWKCVEPPHLLVDEMVEGPFQSFVHHHRFESMDEMRTRMVDEIYYTMRSGWIGHVFSITVFRIYLTMMFAWRKMKMRQLFNES
jgi:ligand-binding SRPBCC domain-containing protein